PRGRALAPRLERRQRDDEVQSDAPRRDHVVVVGCGRVGGHIVEVLGRIGVPRLVVESDADTVEDLQRRGVPVLFGDAANSAILDYAGLPRARPLVMTIPDYPPARLSVPAARQLAPRLP